MTKMKKPRREEQDAPVMPFDEALKKVWASPPQHKVSAKKKSAKKK